jgi:hypothetical protein
MTQGLTLYDLDQRLYAMLRKRQAMVDELIVDPASAAIRDAEVSGLDRVIDRHILDLTEAKKVDGRAYVYKQLANDAAAHKKEGDRLLKLAKSEEAAADRIRARASEYLRQRVEEKDPMEIMNATPGTYIDSLDGQYNAIHLVKNPDGVDEPIDMSLLPEHFQRVTVTLPRDIYDPMWRSLPDSIRSEIQRRGRVDDGEPDKRAILAELKKRVTCPDCGDIRNAMTEGLIDNEEVVCSTCGGKGDVPGSVPGARLKHGVHVRIS